MADMSSPVYEARYGFERRTVALVGVCAVFTGALLLPDMPLLGRVLGFPLFGLGGLLMAYTAMSRKVAFRVDEAGVVLGGNPLRYRRTTDRVPWDEITGVVLWRQDTGIASVPYVGVTRRAGASPLPGDGPTAHEVLSHLVPVPADVAVASRPMNGWRLDKERLAAAVAHFAPEIPIQDHH